MEAKRVIKLEDDEDGEDDDYLFSMAAEAVEADVLASKRRRISLPSENAAVSNPSEREGLYMAALKGDQSFVQSRAAAGSRSDVLISGAGGDSCFKCGKPGHWARDCAGGGGGGNFAGGGGGVPDPDIAEKSCPCGLGICLILTANTERNRGRKFYKCPQRQENGGCGFFEWTDSSSEGSNTIAGRSYGNESLYPGLECPCGAGFCVILTAKTGKNVGQQFYRCPSNQGSSCGFFKWCNENVPSATASKPVYNSTDSSHSVKTGSACFKCGKDGHWARDCPSASSNSQAQLGGNSAQSGTCYKCGKSGHWSRDCTFS